MTILSAQSIRKRCIHDRMIVPFIERRVHDTGMSYGLSSASYDIRLRETIVLFPGWGRLASTLERFRMPVDVVGHVRSKSTWARRFVRVDNTQLEPGWDGYLTIELTRHRPWPIRIEAGTPIAQVVFEVLDEPTEQRYSGKYQNQLPRPVPAMRESITPL